MHRFGVAGLCLSVVAALAGCDSHAPVGGLSSAPTYSTAVREIAGCAASISVPTAVSVVTPRQGVGPTSVLRVGDAVQLSNPTAARVGLTGVKSAGEQATVCRAVRSDDTVLVARRPGYVRVGVVVPGSSAPRLLFVKVTN